MRSSSSQFWLDVVALVKPRVTILVIATTLGGLYFSTIQPTLKLVFWALLGTVVLVGGANAMNMYLERDSDLLMRRTMNRPLPAKRMNPKIALLIGLLFALAALIVLALQVNSLTAILGLGAFISYVWFYTPTKQKSHAALLIGAIPGAMPPLMGWTAATNRISFEGLVLFLILFFWQIPHFLAIAIFRKDDYEKAGIKIYPLEKGDTATKYMMIRYLGALIAVTLYPSVLHWANSYYLWTALISGILFLALGLWGWKTKDEKKWAKDFFIFSIIYLPILLFSLSFNRVYKY